MSYCRWGKDSEVYLYESAYGGFSVNCGIGGDGSSRNRHFDTRAETVEYLQLLADSGIKVPQDAIDRLKEELARKEPEPVWDGSFF